MKITLFDEEFKHLKSYCGYDEPACIEWDRSGAEHRVAVFTERCYEKVGQCSSPVKVAWALEPPAIHPYAYDKLRGGLHEEFDYVLTFDEGLKLWLETNSKAKPIWWTPGGTWIWRKDWRIYPKSKLLSIVASAKTWTEGHRLRQQIIDVFGQKIDLIVGYGRNPIEYKLDALKDYAFTIAIENSRVDQYWTDKLIDPLLTGTIPIYYGSPNIGDPFDDQGILSFTNLEECGAILDQITLELYQARLMSVDRNFIFAHNYAIVEDFLYNSFFKAFDQ